MKKIIFILITFVVGFLLFNNKVLAYNSDATATCYYVFPATNSILGNTGTTLFYSGATVSYSQGEVTGSCSKVANTSLGTPGTTTLSHSCEVNVDYTAFINANTDSIACPNLIFYQKQKILLSKYVFKLMDQIYFSTKVTASEKKGAAITTLYPTSASVVSQGTTAATEADKLNYMTCNCGSVTLKRGSIYFGDKTANWNKRHEVEEVGGFSIDNLTECPDNLYYQVMSAKLVKVGISDFEEGKTTVVACGDTLDLKSYYGTKKNPTDYVEKEDVIKPFCEETAKIWKIVGYLVGALKILVPVIIIVLGSIDLGKAVVAQSEDEIKKGTQLLIKRLIAGIVIFFIPTIVTIVLKMASKYSTTVSSNSTCIECVSKPGSC